MRASRSSSDWLFIVAAFGASSLIFLVQPIVARELLPTLGGAPAVWTACMLFFQTCLLAGYAWAHLGPRLLGERLHALIHVLLLGSMALFLPIGIRSDAATSTAQSPTIAVLTLLLVSIGAPMCILSATSPLIQRWHASINPDRGDRVYRLYSIGNVASLLVLLAYPLAIEPFASLARQRVGWSVALAGVALLIAACAVHRIATKRGFTDEAIDEKPSRLSWLWWIALSAVPSSYLLGVTSYLTSDVAAVPFLWVAPLALYLAAFSIAFAGKVLPDIVRNAFAPALALLCLVFIGAGWTTMSVPMTVLLHVGTFFLLTISCLGELYRRRPARARLTQFYLWIAVGGVIGGIFNSLLAPILFRTTAEYPFALLLCAAMAIHWPAHDRSNAEDRASRRNWRYVGMVLVLLVAGTTYAAQDSRLRFSLNANIVMLLMAVPMILCYVARRRPIVFGLCSAALSGTLLAMGVAGFGALDVRRSFFGVHRVTLDTLQKRDVIELHHGTTRHGQQFYDSTASKPIDGDTPLTYYHRRGPLGLAIAAQQPNRIGVIGLGVGSIAAYVGAGQSVRYFEIDPVVIDLAEKSPYFSYLPDARARGANVSTVLGDARLTLRNEPAAEFDLLVIDAFSGDAIPVHLLTREAFALYAEKITPQGTLAVHISNRFLDLKQVVANGAAALDGIALIKDESANPETELTGRSPSIWAIVTRDHTVAAKLRAQGFADLPADGKSVWTDDYSNLLRVLK